MFKFFFYKRHQKNVLKYISSVFVGAEGGVDSKASESLYIKPQPEEDTLSGAQILYSDRGEIFDPILKARENYADTKPTEAEQSKPESTKDEPRGDEPTKQIPAVFYSRELEPRIKEIRHKARGLPKPTLAADSESNECVKKRDCFDPELVASLMSGYLKDMRSVRPFASAANLTFVQKLEQYIRIKHLVVADVYKAALMDRRLFSKIICDKNYKPSKDTALALIFALKLNLTEAKDMLERAGYTLSHSIQRDIIVEYFIKERVYNLNNINAFLYNMDEKIIGRSV